MRLQDLITPALVLNQTILQNNINKMNARAQTLGVNLRPHLKTAKCIEVSNMATEANFGGITVSTLHEAIYFCGRGVTDMLYAVCPTPKKLQRIAKLQRHGCTVAVITDSVAIAQTIAGLSQELEANFHVLIEIDCGEGRTGVAPQSETLLQIARILHTAPNITLQGVMTHAGQSYTCQSIAQIQTIAEQERQAVVQAADRLRGLDIPCPVVSVGSTPTALHATNFDGVTEIRPGVYMFNDLFQAEIFSCKQSDIALSVVCAVISHRPERNSLIIDAGGVALSKDRSTQATAHDWGYGLAADIEGNIIRPELVVTEVHQEHGWLTGREPLDFARYPVGTYLRILPNHACMTAAQYDKYLVVEGNSTEITGLWPRSNGWG